jgi:hypothetical protein
MLRTLFLVVTGLCFYSSISDAGTYKADIKTHQMTGAVKKVKGAEAVLVSTKDGISGSFTTKGLKPGHVYSMWVAIMNKPEACALKKAKHCTGAEVMKKSKIVKSDVTYGDGAIAGPDGTAKFRTFIPSGKLGYAWFGNGLTNPMGAEIHHDHGPEIPGKIREMLTTSREGCTDKSLPKSWPATARAGGKAGPNKCTMAQFAVFRQK